MKSIHTPSVAHRPDPWGHLLRTMIMALCAALFDYPVLAQEVAPASGGDVPRAAGGPSDGAAVKGPADGAATMDHGIDPVTPQRGPAGLQRRANLKALITGAPSKAAGMPAANARVAPLLIPPGIATAVQRNAIGIAMPGARSPGYTVGRVTTQAGTRLTGLGAVAGPTHQMPVPTNMGPALHGAGLNGTTMGHIASGPGSIGGPAKDRSGINGTLMRPRH